MANQMIPAASLFSMRRERPPTTKNGKIIIVVFTAKKRDFNLEDILALYRSEAHKSVLCKNINLERNEGLKKSLLVDQHFLGRKMK